MPARRRLAIPAAALVAAAALAAYLLASDPPAPAAAPVAVAPPTTTFRPVTTTTAATTSTPTTTSTTTPAPTTSTTTPATGRPVPKSAAAPVTAAPDTSPADTSPADTAAPAPPADTAAPPVDTESPTTVAPVTPTVFAVGDSVMLRAADALRALPGYSVTVDAEVGRQWRAGIPLVQAAVAGGASIVVIHLGTNGPFTDGQFEEMMAAAGSARIVLVTVQLPDDSYPHEGPTNEMIRAGAVRHGAAVVDWNAATNGHPELLRPDGYHMDESAVGLYAGLVAAAL
jgi:hypothetical protein